MTTITVPREEIVALIEALIPEIADNYRADEEIDEPSMSLTVGLSGDGAGWNYQTGDNSYAGGAYGLPHWAIVTLTRDADPSEIVDDVFSQWENLL